MSSCQLSEASSSATLFSGYSTGAAGDAAGGWLDAWLALTFALWLATGALSCATSS